MPAGKENVTKNEEKGGVTDERKRKRTRAARPTVAPPWPCRLPPVGIGTGRAAAATGDGSLAAPARGAPWGGPPRRQNCRRGCSCLLLRRATKGWEMVGSRGRHEKETGKKKGTHNEERTSPGSFRTQSPPGFANPHLSHPRPGLQVGSFFFFFSSRHKS